MGYTVGDLIGYKKFPVREGRELAREFARCNMACKDKRLIQNPDQIEWTNIGEYAYIVDGTSGQVNVLGVIGLGYTGKEKDRKHWFAIYDRTSSWGWPTEIILQ